MVRNPRSATLIPAELPTDYRLLAQSWRTSLAAANRSPRTIDTYLEAVTLFGRWLDAHDRPADVAELRREHVEGFLAELLTRCTPGTVHNRYRGLKAFFTWLVDEEELAVSPMAKVRPPLLPEQPVPVLGLEELSRLLAACAGKDFLARRDAALLRLLADTGMRRAELAGLMVADLNFDHQVATVLGKGRRLRACPFGDRTARDLSRYLRARTKHRLAGRPNLWLGLAGVLTDSGIAQALAERAKQAGLGHLHLHRFRHTHSHFFLLEGGQETDLMRLNGWKSRQMVERYASSAATERAIAAARSRSLGDRI